ncbi:hypothetical protein M3P05_10910 [Sansalvadorimonas sp. 2012CJ34-2]|uniref:Uncharacterized protein n=1 Tax=Parendozoicomonas callyspongiae TaxID=2942213 RepID=A0ABT0PGH7_9GAMM|nr:hypothetical protein [Sansalvadorimonas sp. 2012CJ34-2]MCL6270430.1 hypothetical protein [Sansalvadorimonas sp. 2012CJ34-2]
MNKPYINPHPEVPFQPAKESTDITTSVMRLESIIADSLASGQQLNKYLAEKLRRGEISKIEAVEALCYAVALGESASNATYH